jgi:hypothetical protein
MQCAVCHGVGAIVVCPRCNSVVHNGGKCSQNGMCLICAPPTDLPMSPREQLALKERKGCWDTRVGRHEYAYASPQKHRLHTQLPAQGAPSVTISAPTGAPTGGYQSPHLGAVRYAGLQLSPAIHHVSPGIAPVAPPPMAMPPPVVPVKAPISLSYELPPVIESPKLVPGKDKYSLAPMPVIPPVVLSPKIAPAAAPPPMVTPATVFMPAAMSAPTVPAPVTNTTTAPPASAPYSVQYPQATMYASSPISTSTYQPTTAGTYLTGNQVVRTAAGGFTYSTVPASSYVTPTMSAATAPRVSTSIPSSYMASTGATYPSVGTGYYSSPSVAGAYYSTNYPGAFPTYTPATYGSSIPPVTQYSTPGAYGAPLRKW